MARIKTKTVKCKTFNGADITKARESVGMYQKDIALKCSVSINKQRRFEEPVRFIVIPQGCKVIDEGSFRLMQEALA